MYHRADILHSRKSDDIKILNKKTTLRRYPGSAISRVDVLQEADVVEEMHCNFNNIELSEIVGADYLAEFPIERPLGN